LLGLAPLRHSCYGRADGSLPRMAQTRCSVGKIGSRRKDSLGRLLWRNAGRTGQCLTTRP
jgi:hypothetical protein